MRFRRQRDEEDLEFEARDERISENRELQESRDSIENTIEKWEEVMTLQGHGGWAGVEQLVRKALKDAHLKLENETDVKKLCRWQGYAAALRVVLDMPITAGTEIRRLTDQLEALLEEKASLTDRGMRATG